MYVKLLHEVVEWVSHCDTDFSSRVYGGLSALDGVHKDNNEYIRRRKPWNQGMSSTAMKDYEESLRVVVGNLLTALELRKGQSLDVAKWMIYTS